MYRSQPIVVRVVVAAALGFVIAWFQLFSSKFSVVQQEHDTAKESMDSKKTILDRSQKNLEDNTEEELIEESKKLNAKLKNIQKKLPERFVMEEIIYFVNDAAQASNINLTSFQPQSPRSLGSAFTYYELPISMNVEGSYKQVGIFLDKLSHMKDMVRIKNVDITQTQDSGSKDAYTANKDEKSQEENILLKLSRILATYKVRVSFQMVVFSTSST